MNNSRTFWRTVAFVSTQLSNSHLATWLSMRSTSMRSPPYLAMGLGGGGGTAAAAAAATYSARNDATGVRWTKRKIPSLFVNTAFVFFWRCSRTRKKRIHHQKTTKHRQIVSIFAHLSVNTPIPGVHGHFFVREHAIKNVGGFRERKCHWGGRSSRPIDRPTRVCASSRRWCEYHRPVVLFVRFGSVAQP